VRQGWARATMGTSASEPFGADASVRVFGSRVNDSARGLAGKRGACVVRCLALFSFLYRVNNDRIEILRVFDQRAFRSGSGLI